MIPDKIILKMAKPTLRSLVDLIVQVIRERKGGSIDDILEKAKIHGKYFSLHGSNTLRARRSLSKYELYKLIGLLGTSKNASGYEQLYVEARARRQASIPGKTLSFYHMDLANPTTAEYGWVQNIVTLSDEFGIDFQAPDLNNINKQLDLLVNQVRTERGDIAALDSAYSLLRVNDRCGSRGTAADRIHLRLLLLYHVADLAAQIGAYQHLKFLIKEIKKIHEDAAVGHDAVSIARRMISYCLAQIECASPPKNPTRKYFQKVRQHTEDAIGAYDPSKVSEAIAHHMSPLIAGWAGAHFQRIAASISRCPTQAEFDRMLDQHDEVAGTLEARFPSQLSFGLFGDFKRREDYSNPYITEMLALRALLPRSDNDNYARAASGLYPADPRLDIAQAIIDEGLRSTPFSGRTQDVVKAEMLQWKMVIMLSRRRWSADERIAYEETKAKARFLMRPLGMADKLARIESFHERNAGFRI